MKNSWMIGFLTIIWCGFSNNFYIPNIILGITISSCCCYLLQSKNTKKFNINIFQLISLLGTVFIELIKSSFIIAWDILTPTSLNDPKIISIDLTCDNDTEKTLLATLISLTPGTLSIDLSEDKSKLKIHVMFANNPAETINFIKLKLEPKVMKVFNHGNT